MYSCHKPFALAAGSFLFLGSAKASPSRHSGFSSNTTCSEKPSQGDLSSAAPNLLLSQFYFHRITFHQKVLLLTQLVYLFITCPYWQACQWCEDEKSIVLAFHSYLQHLELLLTHSTGSLCVRCTRCNLLLKYPQNANLLLYGTDHDA